MEAVGGKEESMGSGGHEGGIMQESGWTNAGGWTVVLVAWI